MLFQSLGALLWFLPVAVFIAFLYLLKVRRQDVATPTVFLWPRLTTDVRANALFQKLRPNLLLILQLTVSGRPRPAFGASIGWHETDGDVEPVGALAKKAVG